jgi:hypothetical protein
MRLKEVKAIAANPGDNWSRLRLAHLKLGNAILRAMPSSPVQRQLIELRNKIEAMPRELWVYVP